MSGMTPLPGADEVGNGLHLVKDVLLHGIRSVDARAYAVNDRGDLLITVEGLNKGLPMFVPKGEWFTTRHEAVQCAEIVRVQAMGELKRKLRRLRKLQFF